MKPLLQSGLFSDIKVVELASVLAGPAVGMFFAELGADVFKIENKKTGGDLTRHWKQPGEKGNASAYYHSVNWGKEVVYLDLTKQEDRNEAYDLIHAADIVIANFKKGDDVKLGMDYETLRNINPTIIYAAVKGFENSNRVAFDAIIQAETGIMSINGTNESGPLKIPLALMDVTAAHHLKEGILSALIRKMKTGKGCYVETSLERAALSSLINQGSNFLNNNTSSELQGSLHPNNAPYGEVFVTSDNRSLLLAIGTDEQFKRFCQLLNCDEIADDDRFKINSSRVKNRKLLQMKFEEIIITWNSNDLLKKLEAAVIPAGMIRSIPEVLSAKENEAFILSQIEDDGTVSRRMRTIGFTLFD